jgi:dTDP-4-amino-4,6-dideoxygalactose transaminase
MKIPFVDLKSQYNSIKSEIDPAIADVLENTAYVGGERVSAFEEKFAQMYGVEHCVSCGNGTDALYITLKALGIGVGDEVITAANSFIASSEAISETGAKPVFVDIEEEYFNINPKLIEKKITDNTKAIIPVHIFGQSANIPKIKEICDNNGVYMVEDSAQSHFATLGEDKCGALGDVGTFSFYPGKNLGAYGDGGAIITNDGSLAEEMRMYANHGSIQKYKHEIEGINSRLDGIQAAVLNVKLDHILDWNKRRAENAAYYSEILSDIPEIATPKTRAGARHVFHLYVIRAVRRWDLLKFLSGSGIGVGIHYPTALPFLKAYKHLKHKPLDFPVAHKYSREILSLPMFPELTKDQMDYVAEKIREFYKSK